MKKRGYGVAKKMTIRHKRPEIAVNCACMGLALVYEEYL